MKPEKNVYVIGALPSSLFNFRGELIKALTKFNNVICMASNAVHSEISVINSLGAQYVDYPVQRNGMNPIKDVKTFLFFMKTFKRQQSSVVLAYTIKPIIWGGLAARVCRVDSFYAMVTGLGYAFQQGGIAKSLLNNLVKILYRMALKNASGVIFQNKDNMQLFIDQGIIPREKCYTVNGSGIDLSHFELEPLPSEPRFLLVARLLGDKGIREYCKAARIVKIKHPEVEFELIGPEDPSPDGISIKEVNQWVEEGVISYGGATNDVRPYLKRCSTFVLPSYHEGLPRTVLEAMSMGRPILTTDVPGCRETVIAGVNGWLVEKANVEDLAERMIWFIEHPDDWLKMGNLSHQMAYDKFDVHKVNTDILNVMELHYEKTL
ncbi:glycosyltransferase family 4 protein [Vibrio lentus]|uniref:Glycosyl transferase family 1 n=1 Tax=Vibrio lentus TaxID=136468 RepID=A0AB36XK94_9VIBR|nr:glycosyltransferase family 4 protein [Vibrio lentus]MCC4837794.1 glycosyltransferase family 4 protein [Vibrio lentus]PMI15673.1 glycosyl transferase family 1 [Vibrio lentus]PMK31414.1 glycosyl transferase family 1 [Vibrio lentus]PMK46306.1 glycosyl transferase family 1 [Vibrio lentus]PML34058.1 glycosyl transferase family 1 [Vibrio lentus]